MQNDLHTIDWPPWWQGEGRHFLEGMPFFGPHNRIIKEAQRILALRDREMFEQVWTAAGYSPGQCDLVAGKVGAIVQAYIAWPNHYFFPGDRTAILLGVIPGIWIDAEDPLEEVRACFHINGL